MFILIILLSLNQFSNNSNSQQISFNTKKGCEIAASGVKNQKYVVHSFCVQKD